MRLVHPLQDRPLTARTGRLGNFDSHSEESIAPVQNAFRVSPGAQAGDDETAGRIELVPMYRVACIFTSIACANEENNWRIILLRH